MERILLAMSGGVDSSTAAVLLREAGYDVIGCTMQLWDYTRNPSPDGRPQPGRCCSLDDVYDARRVAEDLGFRFYVLNLEKNFESRVIAPFIESYLGGQTPIPCTLCNTFLKFDELLEFGQKVGIGKVATGHYARVIQDNGRFKLLKGKDNSKDQSYYLFELTQQQLSRVVFPVGTYEKSQIRRIAESNGLINAAKRDSQEICFVPDGDYVGFINRHAGEIDQSFLPVLRERRTSGQILFKDGTVLGEHSGIHQFTIGQRKGLRIAHEQPLYVMNIEPAENAVYVGYKQDLFCLELTAENANWISGKAPRRPFGATVRIRANHREAAAHIEPIWDGPEHCSGFKAIFKQPQLAVTPGQAAVIYNRDEVIGGAWIRRGIN